MQILDITCRRRIIGIYCILFSFSLFLPNANTNKFKEVSFIVDCISNVHERKMPIISRAMENAANSRCRNSRRHPFQSWPKKNRISCSVSAVNIRQHFSLLCNEFLFFCSICIMFNVSLLAGKYRKYIVCLPNSRWYGNLIMQRAFITQKQQLVQLQHQRYCTVQHKGCTTLWIIQSEQTIWSRKSDYYSNFMKASQDSSVI